MGYRKKALTMDCPACDLMEKNLTNQMICKWGTSKKGKIMFPQKGKKPLECKLRKG